MSEIESVPIHVVREMERRMNEMEQENRALRAAVERLSSQIANREREDVRAVIALGELK